MKLKIKRSGIIASQLTLTKLKNGNYEIEYVSTLREYRGNGFAGRLIEKAKKFADKELTSLVAFIEPHPASSLDYTQEVDWFIRKGFIRVKKYYFDEGCIKPVMLYKNK